jgi:hypothetical protein
MIIKKDRSSTIKQILHRRATYPINVNKVSRTAVENAYGWRKMCVWFQVFFLFLTSHMQVHRISIGEWEACQNKMTEYYMAGTWFGQSAACTIFVLTTVLERVDNNLLWFALYLPFS